MSSSDVPSDDLRSDTPQSDASRPSKQDPPNELKHVDARVLTVFRLGILIGAFLLFVVQPMYAKRLLPSLGGSPAVWNTVMVFFQAALLAGYAYAHAMSRWSRQRLAAGIHLGLLALVVFLPLMPAPTDAPSGDLTSIIWLLVTLAWGIGPAFLLVSATSPLVQAWFARSGHPLRDNPYFLYSASNLGSFAALLAYPILIEPWLALDSQIFAWRIGMVVLWLMLLVGSRFALTGKASSASVVDLVKDPSESISLFDRLRWMMYAATASSLLLAVTASITTDLAPVPLLWVIPLAIYLLSFVLAFSQTPIVGHATWNRTMPAAMIVLVASLVFKGTWQPLAVHLIAFTCGVMVCHFALAASRPSASRLTEFYLWVSLGGVIGGIFNALIAPFVFPVIVEYGLAVMLCAFATRSIDRTLATNDKGNHNANQDESSSQSSSTILGDRQTIYLIFATLAMLAILATTSVFRGTPTMAMAVVMAAPVMVAGWLLGMPRVVVVIAGTMLIANQYQPPLAGRTRHVERSFFGVHRVMSADAIEETRLVHGSTIHGIQSRRFPKEPLAYYARTGPLGDLMSQLPASRTQRIGVVGLGAGAIAAYRKSDSDSREMTFFEIDPSVISIATNSDYFTYLSDAGIDDSDLILGDGRAQLAIWKGDLFDGIVLDAFSSDAIPMHLLTREALEIYRAVLKDNGWIAFHVSNQHLDLGPVLGGLAKDAGWLAHRKTSTPTVEEQERGIAGASYVVLSPDRGSIEPLLSDGTWAVIDLPSPPLWTDDFSNLLDVLKW